VKKACTGTIPGFKFGENQPKIPPKGKKIFIESDQTDKLISSSNDMKSLDIG
jgi:hypothetical protein